MLARQEVDHLDRAYAPHVEQRLAQFFEYLGTERWRVDIDMRRNHLHGIEVEVAPAEQRKNFLGDADAIDEGDVDAHG